MARDRMKVAAAAATRPDPRPTSKRLIIAVLVASLVVIVIALQVTFDQRRQRAEQDQRDADDLRDRAQQICLTKWAKRTSVRLEEGVASGRQLREAERDRDDSIDGILTVVLGARTIRPANFDEQLDQVQAAYLAAVARLREARAAVTTLQTTKPYPVLNLACSGGQALAEKEMR